VAPERPSADRPLVSVAGDEPEPEAVEPERGGAVPTLAPPEGASPRARLRGILGRSRTAAGEDARLGRWLVAPAVLVTGALVLYPLVLGFDTSIHAGGATLSAPSPYVGADNYVEVAKAPSTLTALGHTLYYLVIALALEVAGGIAIAVTLHRAFRGRGLILAVLILPWALPSVVNGALWRRVFDPESGLLNSVLLQLHIIHDPQVWFASTGWAIAFITLVHVWGVLPLVSLIFLAGLQSIPEEVYSASAVDGATPWRQFWHITMPLLRPALAVAVTVGTIQAISIFDEIYVLNGTALNTRSILMQVYNTTFVDADFAHGIALAFLVAAVSALIAAVSIVVVRRAEA
jgi:multiple sugar transport system permease protein